MKTFFHILSFEGKVLWRSNTLKALLLVVFGSGVYGIYFGKFEIDRQKTRILQVEQYERQQFNRLLAWGKLDPNIEANKDKYTQAVSPLGVGWNKHFTYYVADNPSPGAGLCLGQRDLFPTYFGFSVADLARQINTGELANPMKLLSGNFDLSYVFVFLFPLLLVALFYNLYAGEKEGGTLPLLQSQSTPLGVVFFSKGVLRLFIVWALAVVLIFFGFILQDVSLFSHGQLFLHWVLMICGYCLFWSTVMGFIVWLRRRSDLTAMLSLGVWLIFTLVTPALINLFVAANEPLPNRTAAVHAIRNLSDQFWKSPKSFVWDKFYTEYPQYNDGDTTNSKKWYYAGLALLDKKASALKTEFEEQVNKRNAWMERWEWLAPAAMVHERLSKLSKTDRKSHLKFIEEVYSYHRDLKELYYKRIFSDKQFSQEDLEALSKRL